VLACSLRFDVQGKLFTLLMPFLFFLFLTLTLYPYYTLLPKVQLLDDFMLMTGFGRPCELDSCSALYTDRDFILPQFAALL
jgi:hypothetical protein